jgi:hypothetical protein
LIRDLGQPGIETGNRVVELARNRWLVVGWLVEWLRNLLDLTGDGIEPLVDFGHFTGVGGWRSLAADG